MTLFFQAESSRNAVSQLSTARNKAFQHLIALIEVSMLFCDLCSIGGSKHAVALVKAQWISMKTSTYTYSSNGSELGYSKCVFQHLRTSCVFQCHTSTTYVDVTLCELATGSKSVCVAVLEKGAVSDVIDISFFGYERVKVYCIALSR